MKKALRLMPLILTLALVLSLPTSVSAAAEFKVSDLSISPALITAGSGNESINISIKVTNTGTEAGTYKAELKINNVTETTQDVTLEAGKEKIVIFPVTKTEAGEYTVSIGDLEGTFVVKASFWSSIPPLVWGIVGVIALVLILIVVMSLTSPKKKRAQLATKKAKGAAKASQLSAPVQPISVQPTPMHPMTPQPFATQQMSPRPMPSYPGQAQQPQVIPQYPGQQQTPLQPMPSYPGQTQQMPPQNKPAYPMQTPKPGQPRMPPAFAPTTQPFGTPPMSPGRSVPQFTVSNLTITPQQVKEGDIVNISAVVTNNSTAVAQYSMVLRIGGVVENISELTLNPGASQTALFTVVKDAPGDYYIEVDGQRGILTVIHRLPAAFTVSNLNIVPERVKQGETITISAIVTNTGETAGNYSVVLRVKGVAESIEEVTLEPGRSQKVVFNITKDAAGFYPVALENLSGKFVVEMDWKG